ncbi:hypothetical protein [Chelativorans alearense]|uniref:hypothetical protein n=1 Tax=Chelativorans alearense TaxID=2681495 RepID=UPI0013D87100|nr:hypothetical protein [Chelativorans alearense]
MRPELGLHVAAALWRRQLLEIRCMSDAHVHVSADVLVAADLMGIAPWDGSLPLYQQPARPGASPTAFPCLRSFAEQLRGAEQANAAFLIKGGARIDVSEGLMKD